MGMAAALGCFSYGSFQSWCLASIWLNFSFFTPLWNVFHFPSPFFAVGSDRIPLDFITLTDLTLIIFFLISLLCIWLQKENNSMYFNLSPAIPDLCAWLFFSFGLTSVFTVPCLNSCLAVLIFTAHRRIAQISQGQLCRDFTNEFTLHLNKRKNKITSHFWRS